MTDATTESAEGMGPARSYSWPPFGEGHVLSFRHGARSERHLAPLVDALIVWLHEHAPWTTAPAFEPTVARWARAEAEAAVRWDDVDHTGIVDADNDGWERRQRAEDRADRLAEKLGLSPQSLAKLLGTLGSIDAPAAQDGLEQLKRVGAELARAAEQRALSTGAADDVEHDDEVDDDEVDDDGHEHEEAVADAV